MHFDVKINTNKAPKIICAYSHCGKAGGLESIGGNQEKTLTFL